MSALIGAIVTASGWLITSIVSYFKDARWDKRNRRIEIYDKAIYLLLGFKPDLASRELFEFIVKAKTIQIDLNLYGHRSTRKCWTNVCEKLDKWADRKEHLNKQIDSEISAIDESGITGYKRDRKCQEIITAYENDISESPNISDSIDQLLMQFLSIAKKPVRSYWRMVLQEAWS